MKTFQQFHEVRLTNLTAKDIIGHKVGRYINRIRNLEGKLVKIGSFGSSDVYLNRQPGRIANFFAVDKETQKIHKQMSTKVNNAGVHSFMGLIGDSHPDKTHELYHYLITKHDLILVAGTKNKNDPMHGSQSPGALKVWQKLKDMPGVQIHAFYNGKAEHVWDIDKGDTHQYHYSDAERKNRKKLTNLELVAHKTSKKAKNIKIR